MRERLAGGFRDIRTDIVPLDFDLPMPASGAVDLFRTYFGPTKMAFDRLDEPGQAALYADLLELWSSANVAQDTGRQTLIHNQYLQVLATRA